MSRNSDRPADPGGLALSAPLFAALGDETRLRLIGALCAGGALSIVQLTAGFDLTRQAITKHLDVLRQAGLVRDVKVGRERLWEFDPSQLEAARAWLASIAAEWDRALERLKLAVEQ